jgi:flagellar motor protein MotB
VGILRLPEALLFSSGSATFSTQGKEKIFKLADTLAEILPCYSEFEAIENQLTSIECKKESHSRLTSIFIEGHTDDVPISRAEFQDNWDLASARAITTYKRLFERQPSLELLVNSKNQPLIGVSAYEARRPVVRDNVDISLDEQRKQNRRIDLRFLMELPSDIKVQINKGLHENS